MARNLINGTNIVIEENLDNISMNLSNSYTTALSQTINDSFKNNNIFSGNEVVVGKWINNKPIYRKVIELPEITNLNTDINTPSGITNLDFLISINGMVKISIGWIPVNFYNQKNTSYSILAWLHNDMTIRQRSWIATYGGYAILEYTKTTD